MSYFQRFPSSVYTFANGERAAIQNISVYAEILDEIKTNSSFYKNYYIRNGDRSDNVSYELYDNPLLHWTFFMMNDHLREKGWPLDHIEIVNKAKKDFPYITLSTEDIIPSTFVVGSTVVASQSADGNPSGATGKLISYDLDLKQLVIETTSVTSFKSTDIVNVQGFVDSVQLTSVELQYLSAHHYLHEDELYRNKSDLPDQLTYVEVTNLDFYNQKNEDLRQIVVIKPTAMNRVVQLFREAISTQ
jgi:hypothetical protein